MNRKIFIISFIVLILSLILGPVVPIYAAEKPIRILLVPGHDNEVWGAQYGNIKEADMNLVLATNIYNIFKKDPRFKVFITRDSAGYTTEFSNYFAVHMPEVIAFEKKAKEDTKTKIDTGSFVPKIGPPHMSASSDVALKLYAFNKWANDNNIDAMIHVHFNDYPRPHSWTMGKYRGFTVYMPEAQMANAKESDILAKDIFLQLVNKYSTSNYPPEQGGLAPDQKLIALGSNGTLNTSVRSVLIEYGYIYRFKNSAFRHQAYKTMADLTAKGIKNYFFPN